MEILKICHCKSIFIVFLMVFCSLAASFRVENSVFIVFDLAQGFANFTFDLYRQSIHLVPTENVIISPLSVANSLALLTQAANGTTYDEIKRGLHLSSNKTAIADQFQKLYSYIKEYNNTITTVNQIYVKEECEVNEKFQEVANSKFMSGVEHLNFGQKNDSARMINQFVVTKTNKNVQNLIKPSMLNEETKMILVNTIHFNNNWLYPFEKNCTHRGNFYISENETVEVEYMCIKTRNIFGPIHNYKYLYDLNASAVEIYFGNTIFSLVIILPNNRTGLTDLEVKLKDYDLEYIMKNLGNEKPFLTIPKFEIEFDIELNPILKNLSIAELFSENADLSEFSESDAKLHVDKIVQKAYFGIDELGTIGTEGGVDIGSTQRIRVALQLPTIVVDHPFVFFVRHRGSNCIIFSGRVQNPISKNSRKFT